MIYLGLQTKKFTDKLKEQVYTTILISLIVEENMITLKSGFHLGKVVSKLRVMLMFLLQNSN